MKLSDRIAGWIKKELKASSKDGIVLGLSGGIDSACVAGLAKMAVGEKNVLGLIMPCGSHPEDARLGKELAAVLNIKTKEVALDKNYDDFVAMNPDANKLAKANLKPRMRMTTLYYFANSLNYIVAGTGNKSELLVGYFTKYGDGGVDILPIAGLLKCEVRLLAEELGVPKAIIERPPSAGLWSGQTDETEMGMTYEELDKTIVAIEKNDTSGIDKTLLEKVKGMMKQSEHKRCAAPMFKK